MYLIIGASGFIGRHLYEYCRRNKIDVLGTYYSHSYDSKMVKFDLCTDNLKEICCKYVNGKAIDAVIICSANAGIDSCKKDEGSSNRLNVINTRRILSDADAMGIKSVFLSSEAVFDGKRGMYTEADTPNPITLYGRQKLQIEQYMMQNLNNFLIFRISRAVGSDFSEKDIFHEFYSKIVHGEEILCLKDQSFCITEIGDIVWGILKALEMGLTGLFHLSSDNYISRYKLAKIYADRMFGGYEKISEKAYQNFPFLDNRHIYGGLNGRRLGELLGINYKTTIDILNSYVNSYNAGSIDLKMDKKGDNN